VEEFYYYGIIQQAVLDSLPDQIAVLNKKGNIVAINKSWVHFLIEK